MATIMHKLCEIKDHCEDPNLFSILYKYIYYCICESGDDRI